jgi:hypothetical protein
MGIDLMAIVGCEPPLSVERMFLLTERLGAEVFRREGEALVDAVGFGGVRTSRERERFCTWDWSGDYSRSLVGYWNRLRPRSAIAAALKRGDRPIAWWAGFRAKFFERCIRMTHIEKYGAFVRNERWGLLQEAGLRLHLRRCCFAVARALGGSGAIYLPDGGEQADSVCQWVNEGRSFGEIATLLREAYGPPPARFSEAGDKDYFIDDFSLVDERSRLYLGQP